MFYVENNQLIVESSYTPLGVGKVDIADTDNGFDVLHHLVVKWLVQSRSPNAYVNGVWWYLEDKEDSKDGKYHLKYSYPSAHSKQVELFKHTRLVGIINWLNIEFTKLIPDLITG